MKQRLDEVSRNCFRGRPLPAALQRLHRAVDDGDEFLMDTCEISLLSSLESLEDGYGDRIAAESDDIAANVRAHRRVFERLAFLADDGDGGYLAYDLETGPADNPPVVHLDSEGQYDWLGLDLGEALLRLADDRDERDAMAQWLAEQEIAAEELGVVGTTTQFLPSISDLHSRWYHENCGDPRPVVDSSPTPAVADDPMSWLLRPGPEVARLLRSVLGLSAGARFDAQWVSCDGDGRVTTVWLKRTVATESVQVLGSGYGSKRADIEAALGKPTKQGNGWMRFDRGPRAVTFRLVGDTVKEIWLAAQTVEV